MHVLVGKPPPFYLAVISTCQRAALVGLPFSVARWHVPSASNGPTLSGSLFRATVYLFDQGF